MLQYTEAQVISEFQEQAMVVRDLPIKPLIKLPEPETPINALDMLCQFEPIIFQCQNRGAVTREQLKFLTKHYIRECPIQFISRWVNRQDHLNPLSLHVKVIEKQYIFFLVEQNRRLTPQ